MINDNTPVKDLSNSIAIKRYLEHGGGKVEVSELLDFYKSLTYDEKIELGQQARNALENLENE